MSPEDGSASLSPRVQQPLCKYTGLHPQEVIAEYEDTLPPIHTEIQSSVPTGTTHVKCQLSAKQPVSTIKPDPTAHHSGSTATHESNHWCSKAASNTQTARAFGETMARLPGQSSLACLLIACKLRPLPLGHSPTAPSLLHAQAFGAC